MFRLPTCPQCGTIYRYGDIVRIICEDCFQRKKDKKQTIECYHCQTEFKVQYLPGILILTVLWAIMSVGTNLLLLSRMTRLNLVVMFVMTIGYMAIAVILLPFFIRLKKCEEEKKKKR